MHILATITTNVVTILNIEKVLYQHVSYKPWCNAYNFELCLG
jgi:hypothetical protein